MKHLYLVCAFFFSLPLYIFADISGTYQAKGFDPATQSEYTAVLQIVKVGDDVFNFQWTYTSGGSGIIPGTGVKQGKRLSVVFDQPGTHNLGTQLYKIKHDVLEGPWVRLGATEKGFERARKITD